MAKNEIIYVCSECGNESPKWSGKCLSCGAWNTLRELKVKNEKFKVKDKNTLTEIISLDKVERRDFRRVETKIIEFDRVLGGGIVPGAVILIGGDPGIGKSTLMLEIANKLDNLIYISGEESAEQIKLRAERLKIDPKKINVLIETDVDEIMNKVTENRKQLTNSNKLKTDNRQLTTDLLIIDSIQTMYDSHYPSTPGSLVQVRETALKLQQFAKANHMAVILVGHVTKDGNVAGPRTLEHLVDVVLYLEGEKYHGTRILRGIKNRFGATDEIGVFEMSEKGLIEGNPSKLFLTNQLKAASGSIITATIEGTRPFLVEIQALTTPTNFGYPKRTASGFDLNRLNLLIAVLTKRAGINLSNQDVYINISGGYRLKDPGADLAVCLAIVSAYKNKLIDKKMCVFGEVGLSGEIRPVAYEKKRVEEAKRMGLLVAQKNINLYDIIKEIL